MKLNQIETMKEAEAKEIFLNESIVVDPDCVRDICLTLENTFTTVKQIEAYRDSLEKKINKGIFDYGLALKGIKPIIDQNIKDKYMKLFCNNQRIDSFLCIDDRIYLYIYFLESILEDIRE